MRPIVGRRRTQGHQWDLGHISGSPRRNGQRGNARMRISRMDRGVRIGDGLPEHLRCSIRSGRRKQSRPRPGTHPASPPARPVRLPVWSHPISRQSRPSVKPHPHAPNILEPGGDELPKRPAKNPAPSARYRRTAPTDDLNVQYRADLSRLLLSGIYGLR